MNANSRANHAVGDKFIRAALIAVLLVGVCVIAGWHGHVRALVQVIPGAIPMQYNTALCFALLGAGAWAFAVRRGARWLPALCGTLAGLMGALVVVEYATGVSLGIDTFFFYPWERTLSADPGRMALTTAVSFLCAGGALTALAFPKRALAPFAILHTLPLSLALTSLLGYVVGITYVLPFRLGSQMAVHTVLCFSVYATAMLAYAWRRSQRGAEGLPRWYPATAILIVPFLFISLSVTSGQGSMLWQSVYLLTSLMGAVLLGLVLYKVPKLKVARKGLVLISVPLAFVLAFVVLVTGVKRSQRAAQDLSLHSKSVLTQTEAIWRDMLDAESSIRGYAITGDAEFAAPYRRAAAQVPEEMERLEALVGDNPSQQQKVVRLEAKAAERMKLLAQIEQLVGAGRRDDAAAGVKSGRGRHLMDEFRQEMETFAKEEERLEAERLRAVDESWQRFDWLLVTGATVDLLLTLMLAFLFSRSIGDRLRRLTENTRRLAEGRELAEPMGGEDEVAHLDQVFHKMAEALSEAARKERAVIENSLDVICTIDGEGRFVKVSPACYEVWGYRPAELVGKLYIEMVAPEDVEKTNRAALEVTESGAVSDFENCYLRKDGTQVHIMWSASWSEEEKLMYCVARDITERKRIERLAEERKLELEKMAASLTAANKELESFSYSVSHDLRAPLRAVDGFSRILLEDYADKLNAEGMRVLNVIRANTQNMGRLIDDLLAFSRLGRKQIESSAVDMTELARDVFGQLDTNNGASKARVDIELLPVSYGDRALLRQVFVNLLSNAAKYSSAKESPVIKVGAESANGENIYYVQDNGVGFDMKYAHKLFGVFQRLHSAEEFEGTGVGLAIAQRIVQRHGGRIWAEGKVGEGATFYFALPRGEDGHHGSQTGHE